MEWQPIETAPKDGTEIWLFIPEDTPKQVVGKYRKSLSGEFWAYSDILVMYAKFEANPTHWMPLPTSPKE